MAFNADTVADLIHSVLVVKPDNNELPKNYMNIVGQPLSEAKRTLGINHLNDLAKLYPDKFSIRGGCLSTIKGEEISGVVDHMDKTVSKSKSRGSRGGSRGGRAGGTSSRGGYQGSYGAAFSSAPRGARGSGFRGGSTRGGNSFGSSDFGGSRGGFGSVGFTNSSSRGGSDSFGGGGFGSGGGGFNDSRRRDPSPPRKEYVASARGGETSSRSDNRGFSSNYDNFAETSRRRGSDDYDDRSYNNRREERYDDRYNDRGRDRDYDDDYDNDRGRRYDVASLKMTVKNEFYDDHRGGGSSSSHRGGDREGYSNRDDGYRNQQSRGYSADEDDWDNRRGRDDRDERGGGGSGRGREEYGRGRDYDSRDDRHSSHDDRFRGGYEDEEEEERGQDNGERRGFPSALNPPSGRPLFAPKPMSDEEEEERAPATYRRSGDTPPDPVRAREPCGPMDYRMPVPPGFEHLAVGPRNAPPGLGYPGQKMPIAPPPGLDPVANPPRDPERDPMKKTPSQRDHELEPEHVPIDELEQLVFSALQRQGGRDVEYDKIIGLILKHCSRDMSEVVQQHGGASPAMEKVCRRSDRLEFETNDDGVDVVRLKEPYRSEAWEKYGRKHDRGPDYVSDDDETESAVSYQSARSSQAERQSVRSSQYERQSVRSAAKPTASANSEAPAEIKQADDVWNFVRSNRYARYSSDVGGYEMSMADVEHYKPKMSAKQHYMFLSRPAYKQFFEFRFFDEKTYVYAMGEHSPAAVMLDNNERAGGSERMRGEERMREERDVRGGSTVSSGRGGGQRGNRDDAPTPRPSAYKFYFREDDPEDGREKLAPGRKGTREKVMLTTFNDFFEFYVMSLKDYERAQQMGRDLFDDHKNMRHCDIADWEKGFVGCHIPEKEKRGYRATVEAVDHDKGQLRLFYVDFGTTVFASYKDVLPLRDSYKKYALCFRCSMEYFTEGEESDNLWSARKAAKQLKNLEVTITPLERRWEDKVLIVELTFVPPGDFGTGPRTYPTDLYRKRMADPPANSYSEMGC